jgi:ATP-dependent Zn protease
MLNRGVVVNARPPDHVPIWQQLLVGFGPTILLILLLVWLYRRSVAGGLGGVGGLVRSRAKLYRPEEGPRTTFADVAGIDEVEAEATNRPEILDPALLRPGRFDRRIMVNPPTRTVAARSSRCTPARCRSTRTSTSPPPPPAWSARTCATWSTRRRSSRLGATMTA